jgi:hypothetical protein
MSTSTITAEARRLVPLASDEPASANAYLALSGLLGLLLWGITAAVSSAAGGDVSVTGAAGLLVAVWIVGWGARFVVAATTVDRAVWLSTPALVWTAVTVLAFVATGYGLVVGSTSLGESLMWAPWASAFGVAYLATGLVVERGGVYLAAGVASLAVLAAGLTVGLPGTFAILGLLHAVPMLVDARRGGRQLTADGTPALRDATASDDVGRVPS